MEDNYSNELIEIDSANTSKGNGKTDENTVQLIQNFTSTIIGLSQQLAENNAAKYRAQAEVMIAEIQTKMQEECQEISSYYNLREKQEDEFNNIIMVYQEQFKILTNEILAAEDEMKMNFLDKSLEKLQSGVDKQLDQLARRIEGDQKTRVEVSKPRSKGLFGLFRRG